jgi:hypothetical protein
MTSRQIKLLAALLLTVAGATWYAYHHTEWSVRSWAFLPLIVALGLIFNSRKRG